MQYIYIHKIVCYLDLDCKSQGALSTSQSSLECFCVRRQGATRKRETERDRESERLQLSHENLGSGFRYF